MTIIFIYFSDLKGHVTGLTDEKLSKSNNLYFDVTVQDSPCQAKKVRVMADEEHSHTKIQNIDSLDCPKSGMSAVKENGYNLICCPEIVSANHQEYYSCRNITCRKKILVKDMTTKIVTCEHCKRKMLLKSLNHTFIVDLILETKGKQVSLTMFPNVIETLKLDITKIEEEILLLENYDFTYNHKKVVTKVEKHEDLI